MQRYGQQATQIRTQDYCRDQNACLSDNAHSLILEAHGPLVACPEHCHSIRSYHAGVRALHSFLKVQMQERDQTAPVNALQPHLGLVRCAGAHLGSARSQWWVVVDSNRHKWA